MQGYFNQADNSSAYAHIIGHGSAENARANLHTVDWNGNAWFAGEVRVGGANYAGGKRLLSTDDFDPVDTVTGDQYKMGISNGLLYIEEVQ